MKDLGTLRDAFLRVRTVVVAVALLCTFALHSVQVAHDHPGHAQVHTAHAEEQQSHSDAGLVLGEYMHVADKKTFAILTTITLLALSLLFVLADTSWRNMHAFATHIRAQTHQKHTTHTQRATNYLTHLFARGILNPKLF